MTFASDVRAFVRKAENRLKDVVVESVYALSTRIVLDTPVDSEFGPPPDFEPAWFDPDSVGEARGGWVAGINGVSRSAPALDPDGRLTNQKNYITYKSYSPRRDTSLNLFNNVPYIRMLEYGGYAFTNRVKSTADGYSYQAPRGMARINVGQWGSIVVNAKAGVR